MATVLRFLCCSQVKKAAGPTDWVIFGPLIDILGNGAGEIAPRAGSRKVLPFLHPHPNLVLTFRLHLAIPCWLPSRLSCSCLESCCRQSVNVRTGELGAALNQQLARDWPGRKKYQMLRLQLTAGKDQVRNLLAGTARA